MIYTVTLSPAIDYVVELENLHCGAINRSTKETYLPGGKGINVSIVASALGASTKALGFLGGFTGEYICEQLNKMGIANDFVKVEGNTRINVKIKSDTETAINANGPEVKEKDVKKLIEKMSFLQENDYLILSGAIPKNMPEDIYARIIRFVREKKVKVIVDTTKDVLLSTLSFHPFLVKPNLEELEEALNIKINTDEELEKAAQKLVTLGAENVIVSLGKEGAFMMGEKLSPFKISSPSGVAVNTVGAGDSLIAGFLYQYEKDQNFKTALKYGVACGAATSFSLGLATKKETTLLYNKM